MWNMAQLSRISPSTHFICRPWLVMDQTKSKTKFEELALLWFVKVSSHTPVGENSIIF